MATVVVLVVTLVVLVVVCGDSGDCDGVGVG